MIAWARAWRGSLCLLTLIGALCAIAGASGSDQQDGRTSRAQIWASGTAPTARVGRQESPTLSAVGARGRVRPASRPHEPGCLGDVPMAVRGHLSGHAAVSAVSVALPNAQRLPVELCAAGGPVKHPQSLGIGLKLTTASVLRT